MFTQGAGPKYRNIEKYLTELKETLIQYSRAIIFAQEIPLWATGCTKLLYSLTSIPPDFNKPGEIYLIYETNDPSAVKLMGISNDKTPIHRKLSIAWTTSSKITISSDHKDFATGEVITCKGSGRSFERALEQYFSANLNTPQYTYYIKDNIQQQGDAFLLTEIISSKGEEYLVTKIIATLRGLISLVPETKREEVLSAIERNVNNLDEFLMANEKIVKYYDARLWVVVESLCKYFDPLSESNDPRNEHQRHKKIRDYFIADCCSKIMRGQDIVPELATYFEAMRMHHEIIEAGRQENPDETLKALVSEYKRHHWYPENEGHRKLIIEYHSKCLADKKTEAPVQHKKP